MTGYKPISPYFIKMDKFYKSCLIFIVISQNRLLTVSDYNFQAYNDQYTPTSLFFSFDLQYCSDKFSILFQLLLVTIIVYHFICTWKIKG